MRVPAMAFCCLAFLMTQAAPASTNMGTAPVRNLDDLPWVTLYVDDDAPGDPGPNDPNVSDPLEDGSEAHPFDTVGEALALGYGAIEVVVAPGVYVESLGSFPSRFRILGAGASETVFRQAQIDLGAPSCSPSCEPSYEEATFAGVRFEEAELLIGWHGDFRIEDSSLVNSGLDTVSSPHLNLVDVSAFGSDIFISGLDEPSPEFTRLRLFNSTVGLSADGGWRSYDLRNVDGDATSEISLTSRHGGRLTVHIADSSIGGISETWIDGSQDVFIDKVHLLGSGVQMLFREGNHEFRISDSTFEQGGVVAEHEYDPDGSGPASVRITGSIFKQGGVSLNRHSAVPAEPQPPADWLIDSCLFESAGISATIEHNRTTWPVEVSLVATNNIFTGLDSGIDVNYSMRDSEPWALPESIRTRIVNNTFAGAITGIRITTNPHIPGDTTVTTSIVNNIVFGGTTGIMIDGTDDQEFAIAGNDVYGSTDGDYVGDISDLTGIDGNIAADPLFTDPDAGDFTLQAGSPCIDAGQAGPEVPPTDYAGHLRPIDGDGDGFALQDIGAFEFDRVDADRDGYPVGEDCDDSDPSIHPEAADLPGNAVDENCDGTLACDPATTWRNHGQFVACVSRTCNQLVMDGRAEPLQCNDLTRQAGRSAVGR